jgi:hypothetical protein
LSKFADYNPHNLRVKKELRRFDDKGGNRFYWYRGEDGTGHIMPGITTWIGAVMPESKFLTDWKIKWGKDWEKVLNASAEYGTVYHMCIEHILVHNEYPPQEMISKAREAISVLKSYDKSIPMSMIDKNLISFIKFKEDYGIEPILIEAKLVTRTSTGHEYALTLDLLCSVTFQEETVTEVEAGVISRGKNKGQTKYEKVKEVKTVKKIALVDFKSNPFNKDSKGFFDSHKYQLMGAKAAIKQNFNSEVDILMNFTPNGWVSKVGDYTQKTWDVTDQDENIFNLYQRIAGATGVFNPKGNIEVFFPLGGDKVKFSDMYTKVSYQEHVDSIIRYEDSLDGN